MAKGFAYFDSYGVMHVVKDKKDAKAYAGLNGTVKMYDGEFKGGYPIYEGSEVLIKYKDDRFTVTVVDRGGDLTLSESDKAGFVEFAKGLL